MSKIKRLEIENCLYFKERQINFGNVNIISGGNAKGKTSILDIIAKALMNEDRRDRFIKLGENEAVIKLETDDGYTIEKTITDNGSTLKVKRFGEPQRTPQTILNELIGISKERKTVLSFNPVDLMLLPPKEQTALLLSLLPISFTADDAQEAFGKVPPVNFNQHGLQVLKALEKYWYDARREANGVVKATEAEIESLQKNLPDNYKVEEWENFSTLELGKKIQEVINTNNVRKQAIEIIEGLESKKQSINDRFDLRVKEQKELLEFKKDRARKSVEQQKKDIQDEIQIRLNKIEDFKKLIIQYEQEIKLKEQELLSLDENVVALKIEAAEKEMNAALIGIEEQRQAELKAAEERAQKAKIYLDTNPEVDIEPLNEQHKEAERMKGFVEMAHNLQKVRERLENERLTAETYDRFVEYCRQKPVELLKQVELPVEGLGISDEGLVTINGLPLKNLNTAAQVKVCLDIARAYTKNSVLKLILIDKLEHLDETARKEFEKQIEEDEEYQYIGTLVTDGDLKIETYGEVK